MVPALVDAIKSHGLALVIDRSGEEAGRERQLELGVPSLSVDNTFSSSSSMLRLPKGVDGLLKGNGVLRFNESIDV